MGGGGVLLPHLFEESNVVRIVVVGEVDDTGSGIFADPIQCGVAIRDAARLRLGHLVLGGHLSCEEKMTTRHSHFVSIFNCQVSDIGHFVTVVQ